MRTAFVAPNRKWDEAEMARVMPRQRDPTHKPTFIPLLYGSWGDAKELIHMGDEIKENYPSGFVFISKTDEPGTPTAELQLFWLPEDIGSLKELGPQPGFAILFRDRSESEAAAISVQTPEVTPEPDVPDITHTSD